VNDHRDRALRIAWRLLGRDAAAAEDVAQEAFVRAYRGLGSFRGEAELATWF
jgi:RNA polymerase sigma-70 factor (ECF subfamily)